MENESYTYIKESSDSLCLKYITDLPVKPILWAQDGRYGWISRAQVRNALRRQTDLGEQQKKYSKSRPVALAFNWEDTTPLDPVTVALMRADID
jgi:hypothetical protein